MTSSSPDFVIDLRSEQLLRDGAPVSLRPKTWAVLRHLVERPGALVPKEELLKAIWPDSVVSEGILNKSVTELRNALGDDRTNPRFVETVPKRGFRWIVAGGVSVLDVAVESADGSGDPAPASVGQPALVGRHAALEVLDRCFSRAAAGNRQLVFVTGEAGAGKSTLVDAFLARVEARNPSVLVAYGQCIEAYGQHEPYRPVLEATERMARRRDVGPLVLEALRQHAPSWLRQMPSLGDPADDVDASTVTPLGMLREIAAVTEEVAREHPLIVILEDAHWADFATIDAVNLLARRRDPARLMIVVTLRAADALVAGHPVLAMKTETVSRGTATEIPVAPFTPAFVQDYLSERCRGLQLDPELATWVHHQTAGNPLFVRMVADDLIERGTLARKSNGNWQLRGTPGDLRESVPDSLRELVEAQVQRLSPEDRSVIEAAAVLRSEFAASSIAAIAGIPVDRAEDACEGLAGRGQMLRPAGRGGSSSGIGRFAFVHSMVQRILHDRLPATRLRRLHLAAAEALEREHPGREDAVAVQLALHYAMAGDPAQALAHLQRAAASVQRIPAPREVIVIREQILDLVESNPGLPGHRRERIVAMMNLAEARQLAFAVVDAETTALCERVLELAVSQEDGRERFLATMGLFSNRFYTGRYAEARDIGRSLLVAAERFGHSFMIKSAQFAIAGAAYRLGSFAEAREHFEACLQHDAASRQTYGWDFQSMSLTHLALLAFHEGRPDDARRLVQEADEHGRRGGGTPDAAVLPLSAYVRTLLGDDADALPLVLRALDQTDRIGAAGWIERARFVHGLLLSRGNPGDEGVRLMKESLDRQARNNVLIDRSAYCFLLAEEMRRRGLADSTVFVDEGIGFMERTGERHFETALLRLREELARHGRRTT